VSLELLRAVRYGFIGQRFFRNLIFHYAITVPFYLSCGLTLVEISLLDSVFWVLRAFIDLPLGFASDTFGNKKALMAGTAAVVIAHLSTSAGRTFLWFAAAHVCLAIGHSLCVGSDSALARGVLEEHALGAHYPQTESLGVLARNLALGISMSVGAVVAAGVAFRLSILLSGVLVAPAMLCVLLIPERKASRGAAKYGALIQVFRLDLLGRVAVYVIFFMTEMTGNFLIQVTLKAHGVDVSWAGISFAGTLLVAAGATAVVPAVSRLRPRQSLTVMVALLSMYFLSVGLGSSLGGLFGLVITFAGFGSYGVVRGIYYPIFRTWIGNSVSASSRATAFGAASVIGALTVGGFMPAFAWFIERFGLGALMLACGVVFPLVVVGVLLASQVLCRDWKIEGEFAEGVRTTS
jgi:predicted MFS family arabinose efflux permease